MELLSDDLPWSELTAKLTKRLLSVNDLAKPLEGNEAQRPIRILMNEVESMLSMICANHSRLLLISSVREIFNPSIMTSAISRPSFSLTPYKFWTIAALKYGNDSQFRERASGREWPDDVIPLRDDERRDIQKFFGLGLYYDSLTHIWYYVGLGGRIRFHDGEFFPLEDESTKAFGDFHSERVQRNLSNILSSAATISPQPTDPTPGQFRRKMLLMQMPIAPKEENRKEPIRMSLPNIHKGTTFTVRFVPQNFDLTSFRELMRMYSPYVIREYGLSADELCCCLECLSIVQMAAGHNSTGYYAGLLAIGIGTFQSEILKQLMRKYIGWSAKHFNIISPLDMLVKRFLDRMVLRDSQLRTLDMQAAWFPSFLFASGNEIIIDWGIAAMYVLPTMLQAVTRDPEVKNLKGQHFERTMAKWVADRSPQVQVLFSPNKKLQRNGVVLAEIDLSFRIGNIGYIIDCKAYSVSPQWFRGDIDAVNTRWSYSEDWISDCIKRTRLLASNPEGDNYRLNEFVEFLVPVVCSPNVEPVWSMDDLYLIAPGIPRVCTPMELVDLLNTSSVEAAIANSYAMKVERG